MAKDKKTTKLDKLIMGVILGGAIGSVIGLTMAPKKEKKRARSLNKKEKRLLKREKR